MPIERARNTSATQRRYDNLRKLIAELTAGDMTADDMGMLLKFSPSGTRKYIRDLREEGVLELKGYIEGTDVYIGRAVFGLTDNPELLAKFNDMLNSAPVAKPSSGTRRVAERKSRLDGRDLHIMGYDTHYAVRLNNTAPFRDPLHCLFYGPPKSTEENKHALPLPLDQDV